MMKKLDNARKRRMKTDKKEILKYVRKAIRDYAGDDPDKWFLGNRQVYARLQQDERKTKEKVRKHLKKSNPICNFCKEKFTVKKGIHLHRLDDNRGYSLENCVLMHQKCHEQYHKENPSRRRPGRPSFQDITEPEKLFLEKASKRYKGKRCKGKSFLYWWDISPSFALKMDKSNAVKFVQKDIGNKCCVETEVLKKYLTPERKTSRGKGNWGIRVLKDKENELAFEPPSGDDNWLFLSVEWQ